MGIFIQMFDDIENLSGARIATTELFTAKMGILFATTLTAVAMTHILRIGSVLTGNGNDAFK